MIELCAVHGYAATTARELASLAGVSTKTIYERFGSKEECFLATYDLAVQQAVGRITAAYRGGPHGADAGTTGIRRACDAFSAELVDHSAASRLALIEILAAGPAALPRIERTEALFATMIWSSFARAGEGREIPAGICRALVGGIWFVTRARLAEPTRPGVVDDGAVLGRWLEAYRLSAGSRLPRAADLVPVAKVRRHPIGSAGSPRLRMLRAAAELVGRDGYRTISPVSVAECAGLPMGVFNSEFRDAEACFLAMLEWLSADALAEALREAEGAPSWGASVYRAVRSVFRRIAVDQALGQAAFVDVLTLGPPVYQRRAEIMRGFAHSLAERAPAVGKPRPLAFEAMVGSVWSIARRHVVSGSRHLLPGSAPTGTFLLTAPIIGAEEAMAVIAAEQ
ncbi:MAG: helix-turn-helix transcriptional regulator [Actinobacteria bacterium]|nr:helix-turn-helix transcriptional regulator [Actinomycetota bacterium]